MLELSLLIANAEGALVRVLGLIERRGFALGPMQTRMTPQGLRLTLTLSDNGRPADVLLRQVKRLCDVREASLDVARPAFTLPERRIASNDAPRLPQASNSRRGMSFMGIPERITGSKASYA